MRLISDSQTTLPVQKQCMNKYLMHLFVYVCACERIHSTCYTEYIFILSAYRNYKQKMINFHIEKN